MPENKFDKFVKKGVVDIEHAMTEGLEEIRTLALSEEDVSAIVEMTDDDIIAFTKERDCDLSTQRVNIRTSEGTSEAYMRSPQELREFLRRTLGN